MNKKGGAIVSVSHPDWALCCHQHERRDQITDDISALYSHTNSDNCRWWNYFELVRASGKLDRHEYHILLDETLGGVKTN